MDLFSFTTSPPPLLAFFGAIVLFDSARRTYNWALEKYYNYEHPQQQNYRTVQPLTPLSSQAIPAAPVNVVINEDNVVEGLFKRFQERNGAGSSVNNTNRVF